MSNDIVSGFNDALLNAGIKPTRPIIPDGTLHRAHVESDKTGTLNLAYVLHLDGKPAGWWMYFRTGVSGTWTQSGKKQHMTAAMRKQIDEASKQRQLEQEQAHQQAAQKARYIWAKATPITKQSQHPYLLKKRVQPHHARLYGDALVIPLLDENGQIVNLQFIDPEGQKRFLSGGKKKGCFSIITATPTGTILVCEGFATGASLFESTGHCVVVAFDARNLELVAKVIRGKYPDANIIIAGDNDLSGVGQKAAREAALACDGKFIFPPIEGQDFNDFINAGGVVYG